MPKPSWSGAGKGAAEGVIQGAPAGPEAAAALGLIKGTIGLFSGGSKKKKKVKTRPTLDPQTQKLYGDYVKGLRNKGPLKDLYNFDAEGYNDVFDKTIGRAANRNFQENIVPTITGQFRSDNLMNSTYAGQSLSRAGRDVQENLDNQRSANVFQGQQNAQHARQQGIENAFRTQTFAYEQPEAQTPSAIDQILNKGGPAAAQWFADYLSKGSSGGAPPSTPSAPAPGVPAAPSPLPNFMGG